ncbi:MAG: HD domain-containing phosphohydrolase [Bdellovibrionota bacterium]
MSDKKRLQALQDIVVEMMSHKELNETLNFIVSKAVKLLTADAASLYLKSPNEETLTFEVAINQSVPVVFEKTSIPISDKGIANYVFKSAEPLNIQDVQKATDNKFIFNDSFDRNFGYTTKSILAYPLVSSKGKVLGVIQVINRKSSLEQPWPLKDKSKVEAMPAFTAEDASLLKSFSGIASAAIENSRLYSEIENLLEGFVKASVHAIESRDPTTSGHSERVAALTVNLAENCTRSQDDGLKELQYNSQQIAEIRYASLLHDFGKIAVKESTLLKQEKLSPHQKSEIMYRFKDFKHSAEKEVLYTYIEKLVKESRSPNDIEWMKVRKEIEDFGLKMHEAWLLVEELNRPTVLNDDQSARLKEISHMHCKNCEGHTVPLLKEDEISRLNIIRGSLTADERKEIESHVSHTVQFLKRIPWTQKFSNLVEIAGAHHEKLNGKGYPNALSFDGIPDQAKMMTICDIFDALVANDRPYKKALPLEKALDILEMHVKANEIDRRFYKVFIEGKSWETPSFLAHMKSDLRKIA